MSIYQIESILDRIDLARVFPRAQPLELELGSGDGSFLVDCARENPGRNFIGVERLLGRIRKLDKKAKRGGLQNVMGVRIESAYFLEYLLPPHSVEAIHVYFPDPWPKRKHRRHRLINERFPALAAQALSPGGNVYLRTDDADYYEQMKTVFGNEPDFREAETPPGLLAIKTDFERDFHARGIPTFHAAFARVS